MDKKELESLVRKIILEIAGEGCGGSFEKTADPSGILSVSIPTVKPAWSRTLPITATPMCGESI